MKIADTSFAPHFNTLAGRTTAGSEDVIFSYDGAASQPKRSPAAVNDPSSRTLAGTLSEMRLNASEPSASEKAKASSKATETEFGKWAKMSPAEKIQARILAQHGLTEESFRSLSKEMRDEIEKEIQAAIKRQYGVNDEIGAGATEVGAPTTPSQA